MWAVVTPLVEAYETFRCVTHHKTPAGCTACPVTESTPQKTSGLRPVPQSTNVVGHGGTVVVPTVVVEPLALQLASKKSNVDVTCAVAEWGEAKSIVFVTVADGSEGVDAVESA